MKNNSIQRRAERRRIVLAVCRRYFEPGEVFHRAFRLGMAYTLRSASRNWEAVAVKAADRIFSRSADKFVLYTNPEGRGYVHSQWVSRCEEGVEYPVQGSFNSFGAECEGEILALYAGDGMDEVYVPGTERPWYFVAY